MDHDLLVKDIVSTVKAAKLFGVPVVHSTAGIRTIPVLELNRSSVPTQGA